jgi:membrane-associated phospholipid phosphatase
MSAHLLGETGRTAGVLAWGYTGTLGFALVYLGEHYVVDLLAGLALAEGIRLAAPNAAPALQAVSTVLRRAEALARP